MNEIDELNLRRMGINPDFMPGRAGWKDLHAERSKAIRASEKLLADAEKRGGELEDQDQKTWESLMAVVDSIKGEMARRDANGTREPLGVGREDTGGRRAPTGEIWRDNQGRTVNVLKPEQRLADHAGGSLDYENLTFGRFVRSMVIGPKSDIERRALAEGTDSAGGFTVPDILSSQLIDRLRARSVVMRAGARTVPLTTEKTSVARLATDPTASWRLENATIGESDPTFESVTFTARSLASLVRVSRELLEDSVNVEDALMGAFAQAMGLEVDRVALLGTGTAPEPRGIKNVTGVNSVSMGANGAALTNYDPLLDALLEMHNDNSEDATGAVMSPRTLHALAKLKDTTNQPLVKPEMISSLPFLKTTAMPVNETQGTASDASRIIMGDYTQLMVGMRTQLMIQVLKERYGDVGQFGFIAWMRADIQLAHPESFSQVVGIIP